LRAEWKDPLRLPTSTSKWGWRWTPIAHEEAER